MYNKFWETHGDPRAVLQVSLPATSEQPQDGPFVVSGAASVCTYVCVCVCLKRLQEHKTPDGVVKVIKMLWAWPEDWPSCVRQARIKFEKFFNHKVCFYS